MIIKVIPSKWLIDEEHRLDCGPFLKGSIEVRKTIEKLHYKKEPLVNLTNGGLKGIYHVGQDKIIWVEDNFHGLPFLRSADILVADLSFQPFISRKQVASNNLFQCPAGSTLITRSGTIGKMAYMRTDMEDTAISQDVLKVVPDIGRIKPGYLYAFLNSKYGLPIITGGTFGSIIVHIEAENITDLPVPRLGPIEEHIHGLIKQAADLRVEAFSKIKKSSVQYLSCAGLIDITPSEWRTNSEQLGFVTSISKITLRAMNYIPINHKLTEMIKLTTPKWKKLGEIVEPGTLRSGPRFKRIDAEQEFGVELIGQQECFNLRPTGRWIAKKYLPNDNLIFVPDGTTMIAAQGCAGEYDLFGQCQFITGKRLNYAYSQHFLRVIPKEKEIPRGALFAYLNSQLAYRIRKGYQIGSMQQDFHPVLIKEMPVPLIEISDAKAIDQDIRASYRMLDRAIDYENEAISLVESTIEKEKTDG